MGIKAASSLGTYLEIPSLRGKTRCEVLGYVLDTVRGKLKNWKQQALSYEGKVVLIKVVACAVPT